MRRVLLLVPALLASSAALPAAAQSWGGPSSGPEIVVYEHAGFRGESRRIVGDVPDLRSLRFADRVSSVRILGGAWEACEDEGFGGRCFTFDRDVANLDDSGLNDRISSLRPLRRRERWDDRDGRGGGRWGDERIVVYENAGFRGDRREIHGPVRDLQSVGFNDRISSLRVESGVWELCQHADFRGRCEIVDGDARNLDEVRFNDEVSSIRPLEDREGWDNDRGRWRRRQEYDGRGAMTIFQDDGFRGRSDRVWRDVPDLRVIRFDRSISSIQIEGGTPWELCEEPYYRGRCIVIRGSEDKLRDVSFNDRAASIRRLDRDRDRDGYPDRDRDRDGYPDRDRR